MSSIGILAIGFMVVWFISRSYFFFQQKRKHLAIMVIVLAVVCVMILSQSIYELISQNLLQNYVFLGLGILLGIWNARVMNKIIHR
jgi:hypothetical protein